MSKTALIVGAGSGISASFARLLAKDGLYEASRVKKFSRKNIFSRSSRRVSAVLH